MLVERRNFTSRMGRGFHVFCYLLLILIGLMCIVTWVLPAGSIYINSQIRSFWQEVGQPGRAEELAQPKLNTGPFDSYALGLKIEGEPPLRQLIEPGRYFTVAVSFGSLIVNVVEVSVVRVLDEQAEDSTEVTFETGQSLLISLLLLMGLAALFPIYQLLPWKRRERRRRAGLCEVCAYDLRGCVGDVCSECGSSIPEQGGARHSDHV